MNKSYVSPDSILETNTEARPIYIPNAVAGYISDLIIKMAEKKVKDTKNAKDAKNANEVDKKVSD
jgi:transcription initiation factor TFIID subunit TAF12